MATALATNALAPMAIASGIRNPILHPSGKTVGTVRSLRKATSPANSVRKPAIPANGRTSAVMRSRTIVSRSHPERAGAKRTAGRDSHTVPTPAVINVANKVAHNLRHAWKGPPQHRSGAPVPIRDSTARALRWRRRMTGARTMVTPNRAATAARAMSVRTPDRRRVTHRNGSRTTTDLGGPCTRRRRMALADLAHARPNRSDRHLQNTKRLSASMAESRLSFLRTAVRSPPDLTRAKRALAVSGAGAQLDDRSDDAAAFSL